VSGQTQKLPPRRLCRRAKVTFKLAGAEFKFLVDVGLHPETKAALEVFLVASVGKSGSMLRAVADDIAVAISHLLQSGQTLDAVETMFAPGGLAQQACAAARALLADPYFETEET